MDKRKGIILAVVLFLLIGLGTFVFADEPNDDPGKNTGETNGPSDTNNDGSTTNPDEESEVQDEENSGTDDERVTATNRRPSNSGSTQVIIGGNTGENTSSTDNPSSDNGSNAGEGEENPGEVTEEPDTTAPVITINGESYQGKGNNIGYVNGDVILSLAEENLEVVVTKDGEELSFEGGMTLSSDGNYIITVTDEAGNVTEVEVSIDTTAPVLNFGNGKIVSEFTVEATDDNFDYMLIKYFDGRKDEIIKDNTFEISGLGDNTRYNITVYDKAGNTSEYRDIYLDNQKPIITGTGLNPDEVELENGGFYQSVSLKVSDGSLKKVVRVNDDGTETELATFEDNFKNIKMLYENTFDEEGTYNIKAIDRNNNEESITFTIDRTAPKRSAANILVQGEANELGTYYATYTATDKAGNTTTSKRKIVVSEKSTASSSSSSSGDVYAKADEFIEKATSGVSGTANKILAIKNYLRSNIKYSHRYNASNTGSVNAAAMKAFTAYEGDCYIHAAAAQVMFTRLGVQSIIVNALDYSHYWNMVYINGGWKHVDPTPGWAYADVGFMNDAKRLETLRRINGYEYRDWDRSKFPVAN